MVTKEIEGKVVQTFYDDKTFVEQSFIPSDKISVSDGKEEKLYVYPTEMHQVNNKDKSWINGFVDGCHSAGMETVDIFQALLDNGVSEVDARFATNYHDEEDFDEDEEYDDDEEEYDDDEDDGIFDDYDEAFDDEE